MHQNDNNNRALIMCKIPLESLLEILSDLYEQGFDYIDLSGVSSTNGDKLTITVKEEYMSDESDEDEEENNEEGKTDIEFNGDNLNDLI
jgi:hypothetical protein